MGFGSQSEQPNFSFVPTVSQFAKEETAGIHPPHPHPRPDAIRWSAPPMDKLTRKSVIPMVC